MRGEGGVGSDGQGGSWGVMEGGGVMGNDGGGRQWWGLVEGEGVVCWASHFIHGPSIFIHVQSFHSCAVILIRAWCSSSFERSWWMVSAGRLSCRLSGVSMSAGAHRSWVGARCRPWVEGRLWGVIVIRGGVSLSMGGASLSMGGAFRVGYRCLCVGIVVRRWGIAFRAWGSSLSVGGGARRLLWFEHHCLSVMVDVRVSGGYSHGWWARCGGLHGVGVRMDGGGGFAWVWAFT